jgi:hypothetical protein
MRAAAIRSRKIREIFLTVVNRYSIKASTRTKICVHQAANSGKSGEPHLHRERPYIKSRSFLTHDFKNLKSVGIPSFGPNL